jgi:hypothetical protein
VPLPNLVESNRHRAEWYDLPGERKLPARHVSQNQTRVILKETFTGEYLGRFVVVAFDLVDLARHWKHSSPYGCRRQPRAQGER